MYAVGITNEINEVELAGISSTGVEGETYWKSPSFNVARDIVDQIVEKTCTDVSTGKI